MSEQLPDTVWPAVFTGANPAKLEKYFYVQYDPATAGLKHVSDDVIQTRPFWEYLSDAGVPVGVVDVPHFKASRQLKGFQVANWGAHATKTSRVSTPPELLTEIDRRFGKHPVGDCDATDCQPKALAGLKQRVLDGVRKHGELTDPATGRHVVKKVTLLHDEFQGPFVDGLPDLTVQWETGFPWSQLHSPVFGTLDIRRQDGRTGSHTDHGFALMYGPEVPHGQVLDECTLYDVAPTILANAGVPTPGHMDGQSLNARWPRQ